MRLFTTMLKLLFVFATGCSIITPNKKNVQISKPNVIIIFTDDQGYNDLGCFDSEKIKTPNLDKMAAEGIRFTDFYVTASICSPSRASLLTGRYAVRNRVGGVLLPDASGMSPTEVTLAEMLKPVGYKTACFGKWHLGDKKEGLPLNQGFDQYYGLPYSNDMHLGAKLPFADHCVFREGYNLNKALEDQKYNGSHTRKEIETNGLKNRVPLLEGNEIVEYPSDQASLTKRFFEKAISFIESSKTEPFFIYLTPTMPHVPLYASEDFLGKSEGGLYGDVVEEIDFYVGKLLKYLEDNKMADNTIVIFTSDNGPWLGYKEHAGSAKPLRGGKFSNYEGGVRVPCIMKWKNKWESGKTSHAIASTLDFLPTIAHYAGIEPDMTRLDGKNLAAHLENIKTPTLSNYMLYTKKEELYGIRSGDWKYLPYGDIQNPVTDSAPALYNLKTDISEKNNVYKDHPEIVTKLEAELKTLDKQMRQ